MKKATLPLLLAFIALSVDAQTLEECISFAVEHSLRMKTASLLAERAKRNEGSYFEIDKTGLTLAQDPTSGGSPDNALTVSQSIDFPTVYTTRKKMLKAETEVEKARKNIVLSDLTKEVCEVYTDMLLHHHESQLFKQNDSVLSEFVRIAAVRYKNGETNRLELLNAEQQKNENSLRLKASLNNEMASRQRLASLINADQTIEPTDQYLPRYLSESDILDETFQYKSTPQGEMVEKERQKAEQQLKHIRTGYLPSFSLGIRSQLVLPGINPYHIDRSKFAKGNWMGFEFGVSFPLFFGSQRAKTAVAKYDVSIANARLEEESRKASADYLVAHNTLTNAYSNYQQWNANSLKNAKEIRRLSLVEYQAGEITYIEHIQNLSAALTTELSAAKATDDLNKAIINVKYLKADFVE